MKIINCEGLSKKYKDKKALEDITFSIEGTGCIGFLGANGAGKTTTMRILTGLAAPTSGKVEVVGYDVSKDINKIRKELGYCPQTPKFYNYMTGQEWMNWVGSMFDLDKETIKKRNEELLKMCGIWEARNRKIGGYSGGMRQRLAIAQALINNPKLLILDEPVSALDPMGRYDVLKLIGKLKNKMTIFMSTHIIDDIARVADKIVIIDKGSVILSDSMNEIMKKYAKQIIEFSIEPTDKNIVKILNNKSWVSKIDVDGSKFKITTNQFEIARTQLLQLIIDEKLSLISYGVSGTSLENVFLKVVGN
ncbi:ABC transporter ATP-binding protein [Oceanirhabdus seepicola]|uniref:ABC transporter ATP-binding protein n=1 Tax=Oceanirhabdus seepicola TaxID=2828781 RepID=A0A9J6P0M0_9CLOT|nr:ABC transporter ATP-binding protein [Oceanirhabdus seepicola]MCM1989932.1 ABC transporter ATP-binding protein [Oceanirhabdus seepicola]